jgi:N-acetylneuraminic acid mutarotase
MKKPLHFLILLFFSTHVLAQNFTWVRGLSNSGAITGTYGVIGVSSPANDPGGRHGCATWTDASGNLWLFGGEGYSATNTISWLSDLWKYNPTTNEWTWMKGSNGSNSAGSYGTQNVAAATNNPGAREFPVTWTDNAGNLWMFGGTNNASSGWYGDLWKYTISTNMWTWVKGFNTFDNNGVYGTLNTPATTNLPGSRSASATWADNSGNLWLFGGRGFGATGSASFLNDLWRYNITSGQ